MKKESIKYLISIVLSFILSVLCVLLSIILILKITIFNEEFFRKQLEKSNYTSNVMDEVQKKFKSYGAASGFDEDFFKGAVSMDMLKADIYREASRLYSDTDKQIDATGFRKIMHEKLLVNIEDRGINVADIDIEAIEYLSDVLTDAYVSVVSIPFTTQISRYIQTLGKVNGIALIVISAITLFCIRAIFIVNSSRRKKSRYFMYALGGTFLMMIIPVLYAFTNNRISKIAISGRALYYLVQSYAKDFLNTFLILGGVFALLWLLLLAYRRHVLYGDKIYKHNI